MSLVALLLSWRGSVRADPIVLQPQLPAASAAIAAARDPQLEPVAAAPMILRSWREALLMVRARSPDLQVAFDDVLLAAARSRIALAALLPASEAQVGFGHQLITTPQSINGATVAYPLQDVWSTSATLVWNALDPRAYHALGNAKRELAAAQSDLAEKRRVVAQALVSAMLATLAAERVAELNRIGLQAALERLSLAQERATYGNGTLIDVNRAQQDVAASRALIVSGDEALLQTREALGLALGLSRQVAAPGDLALDDFERAVASTCRAHAAVEERPDVLAARSRVELAERAIDTVWLNFAPVGSLQSQVAWGNRVLYGTHTTWNLRAVLSIPIWDGGTRYGQLREARAAADQARQALTATRLNALVQMAQASRAVSVTQASRSLAEEQRGLAQRIDEMTRDGFQHGLGTGLELVTSAQALRQAETNLVLARFRESQARVLALLVNADCVL